MADDKPIIVIKKKGGHGGHHGGAWKVAYADFVTAMMAFFMVMWLVNSAETATKQAVASYFRRPGIFQSGSGTPLMIGGSGILEDAPPPLGEEKGKKAANTQGPTSLKKKSGTDDLDLKKRVTDRGIKGDTNTTTDTQGIKAEILGNELSAKTTDMIGNSPDETETPATSAEGLNPEGSIDQKSVEELKKAAAEKIAGEIKQVIASSPELQELIGIVDVKVEADGLNVEIMDTDKSSMFASGSAQISPEARAAFGKIAGIITSLPNKIDIVGHTDAKPFSSRTGAYSNWELSADRANAARRLLELSGIPPQRITSVVGRADKDPKKSEDPLAAANRRITLKMRFDVPPPTAAVAPSTVKDVPKLEKEYVEKKEEVHSLTPREIIQGNKDKKPITLPGSNARSREVEKRENIFGDSPVIKQPDVFNGY